MTNIFFDHQLVPKGILTKLLTDNNVQSTNKIFATILFVQIFKYLISTGYNQQEKERAKDTILQLSHAFSTTVQYQYSWDKFTQLHTHASSTNVHRNTSQTTYNLVNSQHPLESTLLLASKVVPADDNGIITLLILHLRLKARICALCSTVDAHSKN